MKIPVTEVVIGPETFLEYFNLKTIDFKGDAMELQEGALDIGTADHTVRVDVNLIYGASIPSNSVTNDYTVLDVNKEGEHPYPWENLIGVAVCLLILLGIVRLIKEV